MSNNNEELADKLKRWLPEIPKPESPDMWETRELAAKELLEQENWSDRGIAHPAIILTLNMNNHTKNVILELSDLNGFIFHQSKIHETVVEKNTRDYLASVENKLTKGNRNFSDRFNSAEINTTCVLPPCIQLEDRDDIWKDASYNHNGVISRLKLGLDERRDLVQHSKIMALDDNSERAEAAFKENCFLVTDLSINLNNIYFPALPKEPLLQDGPKTTTEMLLCLSAFKKMEDINEQCVIFAKNSCIEHINMADHFLEDTISPIIDMTSDISETRMREISAWQLTPVAESVMKTHYMPDDMIFDFIRYYLHHNQNKIPKNSFEAIDDKQKEFWNAKLSFRNLQISKTPDYIKEVLNENPSDINYSSPSVDDLLSDIQSNDNLTKMNKQKREAFLNLLDKRPTGMEEVVLHHSLETETIRKFRQSEFKSKWRRDFIKNLAISNSDDLLEVGFKQDDIIDMRQTGKCPQNCGWNIEHIIDREHGGTNHSRNFILMPEDINTAKDKLKRLQKSLAPNADKGCFIISWIPKPLADGSYPKVFKGHLGGGCKAKPEPEEESFTPY